MEQIVNVPVPQAIPQEAYFGANCCADRRRLRAAGGGWGGGGGALHVLQRLRQQLRSALMMVFFALFAERKVQARVECEPVVALELIHAVSL